MSNQDIYLKLQHQMQQLQQQYQPSAESTSAGRGRHASAPAAQHPPGHPSANPGNISLQQLRQNVPLNRIAEQQMQQLTHGAYGPEVTDNGSTPQGTGQKSGFYTAKTDNVKRPLVWPQSKVRYGFSSEYASLDSPF